MYYATLRYDRHNYGVEFVDVPDCISGGDTLEEAVAGAHEALALHLREMPLSGERRPRPSSVAAVWARAAAEPGETHTLVPIAAPARCADHAAAGTMQDMLLASVDAWAAEHGESIATLRTRQAIARAAGAAPAP